MPVIDLYQPEDQKAVEALYRRVFGSEAADRSRLRWTWQYEANPNNPPSGPRIWVAREGPALVGQYATMPVVLALGGREIDASWGMDVMVAPERQRQGLGEVLFNTWDRHVGASLGLGLSASSYRLFKKLKWPDVGPLPCLVKPLSRRAVRQPSWPMPLNRLVSAATLPFVKWIARERKLLADVRPIRRFDAGFDRLWERVAPRFDLAVRRDAAYLNWKYIEPPHVRYNVVALERHGEPAGYAVYRHIQEPRGRVTLLVDFLADPADRAGFETLLRFIDREARRADSDKIRAFVMHAGYRKMMRRSGYFRVKSTVQFVAKINDGSLPTAFYNRTGGWHVTIGDSDQDR